MTTPPISVTPLFATPFAVIGIPDSVELNRDLGILLKAQTTEDHREPGPADPLCFRSRETLFEWNHSAAMYLRQQVLIGLSEVVMAVGTQTPEQFAALRVQARARFVVIRPDGHLPGTTCPLASWQMLYCVSAPQSAPSRPDSGGLRLYAVRQNMMFLDASNSRLKPVFAADHQNWRPFPGQMAIFPASALSEIALNRSSEDLVLVMARARFASPGQEQNTPW
jgi:hypothetical protein